MIPVSLQFKVPYFILNRSQEYVRTVPGPGTSYGTVPSDKSYS